MRLRAVPGRRRLLRGRVSPERGGYSPLPGRGTWPCLVRATPQPNGAGTSSADTALTLLPQPQRGVSGPWRPLPSPSTGRGGAVSFISAWACPGRKHRGVSGPSTSLPPVWALTCTFFPVGTKECRFLALTDGQSPSPDSPLTIAHATCRRSRVVFKTHSGGLRC